MMEIGTEQRLRDYAAGEIAWKALRDDGWRYSDVLSGLAELHLRPPLAGNHGPNAAALARGQSIMRNLLARQALP